jgi:hypothetical protein
MNRKIYSQLSIMMFLQIFVWGSWFVTLGFYLSNIGFSGAEIGTAYLTNNIALGASLTYFKLNVDLDDSKWKGSLDYEYWGPAAYIKVRF